MKPLVLYSCNYTIFLCFRTFLGGLETVSSQSAAAATISVISSDSESDAEVENNDLAKFLGLSKSPVVTQALEILGFTPTTPASLNGIGGGIRNRQNIASGTDNSKSTPTSARSKGQANVLSAASNNTYSKSKSPKKCICLGKQLCLSERLKSIFFEKFSLVYVVLHAHNLAICIKIQAK